MMNRFVLKQIQETCAANKIVVLKGAKRSGRKSLIASIFPDTNEQETLWLDLDNAKKRKQYDSLEFLKGKSLDKKHLVISEAQYLTCLQDFIDWALEVDSIQSICLICSFELDLHEELWEALRDQNLEISLFPLTYTECANHFGLVQEDARLEERLIYGYYPEVVSNPEQAEAILYDILETSTFRQLGASDRINKTEKLIKLLRHCAFNIAKVISFNDLGKKCGLDNETVERYIRLFEKAQILFLLPVFSTAKRYELKKSYTIYFLDNGIRNALIRAFQPLEFRNDVEELWKNWLISERYKANFYKNLKVECYFWLTHTKQEVDYLEFSSNQQTGYLMKLEGWKKIKVPISFSTYYPQINVKEVNRKTFWNFIKI